ncbi:MAG: twin-arginine translocase subunit TatC [Chloroflexi bacterium]|nr:twin-arginine translocase subunit TatC [Chloroflexota bacterium]
MAEEKRLTLTEHLRELRSRVIRVVIALVVTTAFALFNILNFTDQVFRILLVPAGGMKPIFIEITEMLTTYFKVALLTGFILALPFTLYQVIMFVAPGLRPQERRWLFIFLPAAFVSFILGAAFCYFVLLPPAVRFLLSFGGDLVTPQIRISNYMDLVLGLMFWVGIVFETPLVMYFLARLGIVSPQALGRFRKFFVVLAFVIAAVITPTPDPINQALVAVPLIILYELGVQLARLAARARRRAQKSPS